MKTDRTIILTMLANQQINADEAERLLILTEALHRIERSPHPSRHDEPLMSQLVGDLDEHPSNEYSSDEHHGLELLTDINDLVDFEALVGMEGMEEFFTLPDLPPFPEVIDVGAFVHLPDDMPFDTDGMLDQFKDLHERLEHMKEQFAEMQGRFVVWQDDIGFDSDMV